MAQLILRGDIADVELLDDPDGEQDVTATCIYHAGRGDERPCAWAMRFDSMIDAVSTSYAANHADKGQE